MCSDLLPESVNSFLDDVETSTCLPILVVIVFCTLQFIMNHVTDIGCAFCQIILDKQEEYRRSSKCKMKEGKNGLVHWIKEAICKWFLGGAVPDVCDPKCPGARSNNRADIYREKEWRYYD